ncbi:hypothetical protein T492DRAFT_1003811 [Pavlovales sp. CCMP2436]|nr:hypothetical protein T492DRAFT_1003811 [Pavlovales sp. CCMP2436]
MAPSHHVGAIGFAELAAAAACGLRALGDGEMLSIDALLDADTARDAELLVRSLCARHGCALEGATVDPDGRGLLLRVRGTARKPHCADILDHVRHTCCELKSSAVSVDVIACIAFATHASAAASAEPGEAAAYHEHLFVGVDFASTEEEISALLVLDLLNLGSGYKLQLAACQLGRYKHGEWGSAFVCMLEGTEAAARAGPLTAVRMAGWTIEQTETHFQLPAATSEQGEARAREVRAALVELNSLVTSALRSAGEALLARGHASGGALVLSLLRSPPHADDSPLESDGSPLPGNVGPARRTSLPLTAASLVETLASFLPPFNDVGTRREGAGLQGGRACSCAAGGGSTAAAWRAERAVPILKKAQLLTASLHARFGGVRGQLELPEWRLVGVERLTVAADPVLPAVLRAEGCLLYSDSLSQLVDGGMPVGGADETEIRASTIVACEVIRVALGEHRRGAGPASELAPGHGRKEGNPGPSVSASELDLLLWGVLGKSGKHRHAPRHITRGIWWH